MSKRARLGVVGLGRMGRFHAENVAWRTPSATLSGVVDVSEAIAQGIGERLSVPWSTSLEDLLDDADLDGVIIATPTPLHAEMIRSAASAGKHVFCEKPLALELEPTHQAIDAAHSAGIKLQVGFHRRFDPDWAAATARIRAGELGDLYLFRTSLRDMSPPTIDYLKGSGGFFVDVTIHDLDVARWMVGEIEEISAFGEAVANPALADLGDIDNGVVVLRFVNGALGVIDNSRNAGYGYECSTEVMGSLATVRVDSHRRVNNVLLRAGEATVDWVEDFTQRFAHAYVAELEEFSRSIHEDRPVAPSGEDALAAFVLARAADRSRREGRPVKLRHELSSGAVVYDAGE